MQTEEFLKISYDPHKKMWSSVNYPYGELVKGSIGERFLATMRSTHPSKVIDYFYETGIRRGQTVKELYEQSIIVAANLTNLGIVKGDVVVFFCQNNEHLSILTMGCILIGAVVNFCEVHLPEEQLDMILNTLQPIMILYEYHFGAKCFHSIQRMNLHNCKYVLGIDGPSPMNGSRALLTNFYPIQMDEFESVKIPDPENELAFLVHTAGATGKPKVVEITHTLMLHSCNIWWNNKNNYEPLNSNSVLLAMSPFNCISQYVMLLQSMLMGISRVSFNHGCSAYYRLEVLRRTGVTHLTTTPTAFISILKELDGEDVKSLQSLKYIQLSGAQTTTRLLNLAKKHCVNAKIFRCYGMTEMAGCIANDENINGGTLLPGYQLQIVDYLFNPLGHNQKGQILLKPPYALKGYNSQEHTAYYNQHHLFISGDYGFIDDYRKLHVLGRYNDLIYSNDVVIVPNAVEQAVMLLPEVYAASLIGYRNPQYSLNQHAALFVILEAGIESTREICERILGVIRLELTSNELEVFKSINFISKFPATSCGKLKRAILRRIAYESINA